MAKTVDCQSNQEKRLRFTDVLVHVYDKRTHLKWNRMSPKLRKKLIIYLSID